MGVAIEQSRMVLPQNVLTEWTWSGTLGAFAKMCTLRLHPEAQYEARLVAQQVYEYLKEYWPVGAKALVEGPDV
jgi:thymidylate synthase (FAD)